MSNIDRLRVGGTDYDIQSVVKVYNTIADMNADIANIPNGATVFVKENSPSGLEGDDELDPTSSNWVKNSALAEAVVTFGDGSSTPSIPDSELRHSDMSNTQVNDVNKVPTSALLYQMNSDLASVLPSYVEASGTTYSALFNAIGLLIDMSKMTPKASLVVADGGNFNTVTVYNCIGYTTRYAIFQGTSISNDWTSYYINRILVDKQGTSSLYINAKTTTAGAVTISDYSSTALSANSKGRLYYN